MGGHDRVANPGPVRAAERAGGAGAVVLCVDETSTIQALNRFLPTLSMRPATPVRRSHDYVRHGTTSLFAALVSTSRGPAQARNSPKNLANP